MQNIFSNSNKGVAGDFHLQINKHAGCNKALRAGQISKIKKDLVQVLQHFRVHSNISDQELKLIRFLLLLNKN